MDDKIIFEQPLNERMRSFMRLEFLFRQSEYYLGGEDILDARNAMTNVLEIQSLVARSDLKTEVLKELERHSTNLTQLQENPSVDGERLAGVLQELDGLIERLYSNNQPLGRELKNNEFLNSIKQRLSIPGGTCEFDLPGYHYWLQQDKSQRDADLAAWLSHYEALQAAIGLILEHIRQSALPRGAVAAEGFYQQTMDASAPCQILRIALRSAEQCFPEVSAGKHRFTIRFLELIDYTQKPKQTQRDVPFELACCMI